MIAALEKQGFVQSPRSSTSHVKMKHADGRVTIVAIHSARDLPRPIVRAILRQTKLTAQQLFDK